MNTWEIDSGEVFCYTTNTTRTYNHVIIFIEPYVSLFSRHYSSYYIIGKGEISQKTFFTIETTTTI